MVLIGFVARVLYIWLAHTYKFRANDENFSFGWEIGRIAQSIATGHGFSSPFYGDTGPTAWAAPVYPYIVAGAFKIFGLYTRSASFALLTFNSFFSALTAWTVYRIAQRMFNETVAVWSGWLWVFLPNLAYWGVRMVWETSLSTFLLTALILLTLKMEGDDRFGRWIFWGALWGFVALTNTSICSFTPFAGLWLVYKLHQQRKSWFLPALASAIVFFAVLSPWLIRNDRVFHKPFLLRGNFGVELHCGNNDMAEGLWVALAHPTQGIPVYQRYKAMGEVAYVAQTQKDTVAWIKAHKERFAVLTFRRFVYFWSGPPRISKVFYEEELKNAGYLATACLGWWGCFLALKKRIHAAGLFACLLIFYPAVYYITFPNPRYRHPLDPVTLILGVFLVSQTRPDTEDTTVPESLATTEPQSPVFHTLSIIIPVYNERRTVMQLLNAVARQPIGELHKEMVIVDDFSTDGTREFLQEMDLPSLFGKQGITVKVVLHEMNKGKGAGVRTALEHCTGELVLMQDADLEYDPADYPALLKPLLDGHADAVFGNRFHYGSHRVPRFYRFVLNRVFSITCNMLTGLALNDVTACYKVLTRDLFNRLNLKSDRFSFETELTVKLAKLKARIYEVPIVYHGRTYAEGKKINWTDGVAAFYHLIRFQLKD
ncbi:glycosyltransferase [Candidatus Korobacter versatilis]|nr:glycosyltransferase [Candidatus Koribacter versatilis]